MQYSLLNPQGSQLQPVLQYPTQHKKASNHHANLPLEMYSFTL